MNLNLILNKKNMFIILRFWIKYDVNYLYESESFLKQIV